MYNNPAIIIKLIIKTAFVQSAKFFKAGVSTVVGSRKSLSPRIKSSNDDFYTNRRSDKFSITYPKSAEIYFGEKYLSLF